MDKAVAPMDHALADKLERFIEQDALWEPAELDRYRDTLGVHHPGSPAAALVHTFAALRIRLDREPVPQSLRRDAESVVYPGLWKVVEAVRDGLPLGEQLVRARTLNRRLAHLFAAEDDRA